LLDEPFLRLLLRELPVLRADKSTDTSSERICTPSDRNVRRVLDELLPRDFLVFIVLIGCLSDSIFFLSEKSRDFFVGPDIFSNGRLLCRDFF
jgi:hypothetical protein